jgi:ligand-binding sensor domain-containing protein
LLTSFSAHLRHHFTDAGQIDDTLTCLDYDNTGNLWIGNQFCLNVRHQNLIFDRVGGLEGLPYPNITVIAGDPRDGLWVGTKTGVIRYRESDAAPNKWKFMRGDRWIHGDGLL